jgi:hypothetical protein
MAKRTCTVDGCEGSAVGQGLCRKHYSRWQRHGTTADPQSRPEETCSIDGCDRPVKAHGWCQTHYRRWQRHGDPEARLRIRNSGTPEERWWARVNKDGPIPEHRPDLGPCWLWIEPFNWQGYGWFSNEHGRSVGAHRWGFERFVGPIREGFEPDHLCRVPACVRFDHLEPVTHQENVQRGSRTKWLGVICVIEGCAQAAKARGLCHKHYKRQWRLSRK